jgi:tRNA nucleotidyltransferase/poly(A) polymerase
MWYGCPMTTERTDTFMARLGAETYRVGGSVRDELLGGTPKDNDYMVRGVPLLDLGRMLLAELIAGGYPKPAVKPLVLRDGRQAGWRVSARGLGVVEIVLPRTEVSTGPGHRDFDIKIDPDVTLDQDAKRRDFTFNALYKPVAQDLLTDVVDPTGRGLYDLEHKLISTTHETSFRDDPLRTLRALRFVSKLGYDLTAETQRQMETHASAVTGLSAKGYASGTVIDELSKMLMGADAVKALRLSRDTGVLASILPELAPMCGFDQGSRYHDLTTDEHTFKALETAVHVDAPLRVRWALLFHDSGKPESAWVGKDGRKHYYAAKVHDLDHGGETVLTEDHEVVSERIWRAAAERLGIDRSLREEVATLVRNHMVPIKVRNPGVRARKMRTQFGDAMLRDLLLHRMCDISGKGSSSTAALASVAELEAERQAAQIAGVPASVKELAVNGHDCIEGGLTGRDIGAALGDILHEVVCQPDERRMSREWQLGRLGFGGEPDE